MPGTEPSTPICWPNREALMSFLCVFLAQLETALSLKSCDSWLQVPDYGKVSHLHQGSPWCVQGNSFWAIALSLPVGLCSWTGTGWQSKMRAQHSSWGVAVVQPQSTPALFASHCWESSPVFTSAECSGILWNEGWKAAEECYLFSSFKNPSCFPFSLVSTVSWKALHLLAREF